VTLLSPQIAIVEMVWRDGVPGDDEAIIALCLELNREDPGLAPVTEQQVQRTLSELRSRPIRGKAVVLDLGARVQGYAMLISFWSNELGGEVCTADEIFVEQEARGYGYASTLLLNLPAVWGRPMVASMLESSPANQRAAALYRRLGFEGLNTAMVRRHPAPEKSGT
jgi:ribosomal protein S18 acetylase RimI-like enzyme